MRKKTLSSRIRGSLRLRKVAASLGYHTRPSLIIIGAQKSGTSGLFRTLEQHPQVVAPIRKELHFFDDGLIKYPDFRTYHSMFPYPHRLPANSITLEATPSYLYSSKCPQRIHSYDPSLRLVAVLREPVERAYSGWNMYSRFATSPNAYHRRMSDPRTFDEAVMSELDMLEDTNWENDPYAYVKRGIYVEQLERYFQHFSRYACLILDYHDLVHNPEQCLAQVCRFAGIDEKFRFTVRQSNVSTYTSTIPSHTRDLLHSVFAPYNERLFELLGRRFEW